MYMIEKIGSLIYYLRRNLWRFNVRAWLGNLSSVEISRPIFLLGTQGGGLTLVSRILRRNPALVSVTGGHRYWNGADEMQSVMAPILPEPLRLKGRKELERFRSHGGWTYACDELFQDFRMEADDVKVEDAQQFRHAIRLAISMYGTEQKPNRFIDKSQSYSLKVSYINEILGEKEPYFILITRNPYAVCKRATKKTNLSRIKRDEKDKIDMAVQHWGNTMMSAIEDSKKVKNFELFKIEKILKNTKKEVVKMCDFLDIRFNDDMLPSSDDKIPVTGLKDNKWYPIRKNINRKYLKNVDEKMVNELNKEYSRLINSVGYKIIEV